MNSKTFKIIRLKLLFVFLAASDRSLFDRVTPTVAFDNLVAPENATVFSMPVTFSFFVSELEASRAGGVADFKMFETFTELSCDSELEIGDVPWLSCVVAFEFSVASRDFNLSEADFESTVKSIAS